MPMRRVFLPGALAITWILVCTVAARSRDPFAEKFQSPDPAATQQTDRKDTHESRLEWLTQRLNLTQDEQNKLKPILDDEAKQVRAVRDDTSLSPDQRRARIQQIRKSTRPQIEAVLTPDQQKKFDQLKEERPEKKRPS
jgi:periplasmic protein CpxP/Spy